MRIALEPEYAALQRCLGCRFLRFRYVGNLVYGFRVLSGNCFPNGEVLQNLVYSLTVLWCLGNLLQHLVEVCRVWGSGFLAQGLGILTAACRFEGSVEGLRVSIGALVSFSPSSLNLSLSTEPRLVLPSVSVKIITYTILGVPSYSYSLILYTPDSV